MIRNVIGTLAVICSLAVLSGCYGTSTGKMCQVCKDLSEGKAEGSEWAGEYINEKFQCKLEGGQIKVQHKDEWEVCG